MTKKLKENYSISTQVKVAIMAAAIVTFMGVLVSTSLNVTFPELSNFFHVPLAIIQWVTTGYYLVVTIVVAMSSYLLKRYPTKNLFVVASGSFLIGDLICMVSLNFPMLLVGRVLQATATGLSIPIMYHIIFSKVPKQILGKYIGLSTMVVTLAPALGPTYGGFISTIYNWRGNFLFLLPIAIIDLIIGYKTINIKNIGVTKKFDYLSLGYLFISILFLLLAADQLGIKHANFYIIALLLLISFLTLGAFIYQNNHGNSRLIDLSIFKRKNIKLDAINYFILQFMNIGCNVFLPVYAELALNVNAFMAGLMVFPGALIGALISPVAGSIRDKFGSLKPILVGDILVVISCLSFVLFQPIFTVVILGLLYCIFRLGFNTTFPNTLTNAREGLSQSSSIELNTSFNMLQQGAGSVGATFLTSIVAFYQVNYSNGSHLSITNSTFLGGRAVFYFLFAIGIVGLITETINWKTNKQG